MDYKLQPKKVASTLSQTDSRCKSEDCGLNNYLFFKDVNDFDLDNIQRTGDLFLSNALQIILSKLSDNDLDLEVLTAAFNVSKSTLQRKLTLRTGMSPCRLIYFVRMKYAQRLLSDHTLNISEVAYKVGYNDPRYFSRCFKSEFGLTPKEFRQSIDKVQIKLHKMDNNDLFVEKAIEKIENKIADSTYSVDQFALDLNYSKSTLHRKIKEVTGLSPGGFIRTVRLYYAKSLLEQSQENIIEVAFASGFSDVKYFSKCFRIEFGISPKELTQPALSNWG